VKSWKRREADAAEIFGAKRQPLSGSSGRADLTASDTTHGALFIEVKVQAASAVRTLWEKTRGRARAEGKMPVLMLYAKNKPGGLVVCHAADLAKVAAELAGPEAEA
jgi:hypothetical protein